MPLASIVRTQIETALSQKIPSALTPAPKMIRPVAETGIEGLDEVLKGGLPVGAISELVGPESSGRTSTALSFLARIMQTGRVCAWIDVSDSLDPASASAAGIDLSRLLWVRCGVRPKAVPQSKSHFALPNKYLVSASCDEGPAWGRMWITSPRRDERSFSSRQWLTTVGIVYFALRRTTASNTAKSGTL